MSRKFLSSFRDTECLSGTGRTFYSDKTLPERDSRVSLLRSEANICCYLILWKRANNSKDRVQAVAIRQFEYLAEVENERFLSSVLKIPTQSVADLAISERDDIHPMISSTSRSARSLVAYLAQCSSCQSLTEHKRDPHSFSSATPRH